MGTTNLPMDYNQYLKFIIDNPIGNYIPILKTVPNVEELLSFNNLNDGLSSRHFYNFDNYGCSSGEIAFKRYFDCLFNAERAARTILEERKKLIKYKVGFLYLYEIYGMFGLKYIGNKNIGMTTDNPSWHEIDAEKEIKNG